LLGTWISAAEADATAAMELAAQAGGRLAGHAEAT
jgi:hypothetical protein